MNHLEPENTLVALLEQIKELTSQELGTFYSGAAAIWAEPPEAPKTGTGLHIYIGRFYQQISKTVYQWQVRLVQIDLSLEGLSALDRAIDKIRRQFPNRREVILPYAENRYPSVNFYIPFQIAAYSHLN